MNEVPQQYMRSDPLGNMSQCFFLFVCFIISFLKCKHNAFNFSLQKLFTYT